MAAEAPVYQVHEAIDAEPPQKLEENRVRWGMGGGVGARSTKN